MKTARTTRGVILSACMALFIICFSFQPIHAKTIRMVIGGGFPVPPHMPEFGQILKKSVEAETKHKVVLINAYGGTIAKVGEALEAVRDGLLNVGVLGWAFNPNELFLHNWGYSLPFSSPDPLVAQRVGWRMLNEVPELREVFEKKHNQKLLAASSLGGYHMITTFPVKSIDDLKNRKIGGAGPNLGWLKDAGAIPVQANAMGAYTSLQTGVYDGMILNDQVVAVTRLYEVAKYYTLWDLGDFLAISYTVNLDFWNTLPEEVQEIFIKTGEQYGVMYAKWVKAVSQKVHQMMKMKGVTFYQMPFEEKKRWADAMKNYAKGYIMASEKKGLPAEKLVKSYISALEAEGYQMPRRWVNP